MHYLRVLLGYQRGVVLKGVPIPRLEPLVTRFRCSIKRLHKILQFEHINVFRILLGDDKTEVAGWPPSDAAIAVGR